jgi:hypothetical protein
MKACPLQYLYVISLASEITCDYQCSLAQFATARLAIEFDDAPVFLQTLRVRLVDQKMRVILDRHEEGIYLWDRFRSVTGPTESTPTVRLGLN